MDVPPGSTDLLLKKLLKIKNLSIFILIQLLHCLMNNKISLQFVITGGTMFYMIQESLKFIHRQAVVNKTCNHALCCPAIHFRHWLPPPVSVLYH